MSNIVQLRSRKQNAGALKAPAKSAKSKPMTVEEFSFDKYRADKTLCEREIGDREYITKGTGGKYWCLIYTYEVIDKNGEVTGTKCAISRLARAKEDSGGHIYEQSRVPFTADRGEKLVYGIMNRLSDDDFARIVGALNQASPKQ